MDALQNLGSNELHKLSRAFASRRLQLPVSTTALSALAVPCKNAVIEDIAQLEKLGFSGEQIAVLLDSIVGTRAKSRSVSECVDLVASGPDLAGISNRETSVVVQQLFRDARESVVVVGYSVYQGNEVFSALADTMEENPKLNVTMCLNIGRNKKDSRTEYKIRNQYLAHFRATQWPEGKDLPKIYFDPRAIAPNPSDRASLHAKCVVIDDRFAFVSSANFTGRGQKRNIEIGVRIDCREIAIGISTYIANLIDEDVLQLLS